MQKIKKVVLYLSIPLLIASGLILISCQNLEEVETSQKISLMKRFYIDLLEAALKRGAFPENLSRVDDYPSIVATDSSIRNKFLHDANNGALEYFPEKGNSAFVTTIGGKKKLSNETVEGNLIVWHIPEGVISCGVQGGVSFYRGKSK